MAPSSRPVSSALSGAVARSLSPGALARRVVKLPFPFSAPPTPQGLEPVAAPVRSGGDYDTAWARRRPARLARAALLGVGRPVVAALADPEVRGLDRLDQLKSDGGPVIFSPNHHSHVDTPVMMSIVPEPWRHRVFVGAAADYFFRTPVTSVLSALAINAVPIERTRVSRRSADRLARLLDAGWTLLVYPEGGRSPDGWGQSFKAGAAYLAKRCDVPVVPVHIEGTGAILRKGRTLPKPSKVRVTFGHPLRPAPGDDARRFATTIESAVAALADEATTDWWQARRRAHAGETPPLTGPDSPTWRRAWALGADTRSRRRTRRRWPEL